MMNVLQQCVSHTLIFLLQEECDLLSFTMFKTITFKIGWTIKLLLSAPTSHLQDSKSVAICKRSYAMHINQIYDNI